MNDHDEQLAYAAWLDREPIPCVVCGHPLDDHHFGCEALPDEGCPCVAMYVPVPLPPHDEDAGRQWELDHPGGVISAEEQESMARYAYEACREEGCRDE